MITAFRKTKFLAFAAALLFPTSTQVSAHPHVFVEASLEIVRNEAGEFSKLRHVWRFDELFSSTLVLDFDENGNGSLDEDEIKEITTTVKKSIAEYDFYTAIRQDKEIVEFYPPETFNGYMENGQMIMFLEIEPAKKYNLSEKPIRISASDVTYYVAFEVKEENVKISGPASDECKKNVTVPDFDKLYAENEKTLSEAFFNEENPDEELSLGDEFYTWSEISCS